jgi:hypothetical protein
MPAVTEWLNEVEALSGGRVVIVPVETDRAANTLSIPPLFPGRDIVRGLLSEESFVAQFIRAHALTVHYEQAGRRFHFILLNMALAGLWGNHREQLLAHEAGHLWLNAHGYRSLIADPASPEACLATHTSDIVQHILIREEMARRGYDSGFWIHNQQEWLRRLEQEGAPARLAPCERPQVVSNWIDGALGLTPELWPQWPRWNELTQSAFPELVATGKNIAGFLRGMDLWDRSLYEAALSYAGSRLRQLL